MKNKNTAGAFGKAKVKRKGQVSGKITAEYIKKLGMKVSQRYAKLFIELAYNYFGDTVYTKPIQAEEFLKAFSEITKGDFLQQHSFVRNNMNFLQNSLDTTFKNNVELREDIKKNYPEMFKTMENEGKKATVTVMNFVDSMMFFKAISMTEVSDKVEFVVSNDDTMKFYAIHK